jgi:uncharacterized membrane protein
MKPLMIVGLLLIVLGLVGLLAGGVTYTKEKETADLGPVGITVEQKKRVEIPPAVSVVSVVAGVVLLLVGSTRRRGA